MRRKRAKHNVWDKRIVPILVASILLFTLMISPLTKPLGANAAQVYQTVTQTSKYEKSDVYINKTVVAKDNTNRKFEVKVDIYSYNHGFYNWTINDEVGSHFTIVSTPDGVINSTKNTVSKDFPGPSSHFSMSYIIQAKDNVLEGDYPVNTVNSIFVYKNNKDKRFNIIPPTIHVGPVPSRGINFTKSATIDGDNKYRITFHINGTPQMMDSTSADVIFLIDKSGSMDRGNPSRLSKVKESIKQVTSQLLSSIAINNGNNIRFALVSFAGNAKSEIDGDFTNKLDDIYEAVDKMKAEGGTNTTAGIKEAGKLLKNNTSNKKYVIMFTDGIPTYYLRVGQKDKYGNENETLGGTGYEKDVTDACFGYAQMEYNRVIGGITSYGGIIQDNSFPYKGAINESEKQIVPICKEAKFYSIGFTSINSEIMKEFLKTTQNVVDQKDYAENYCTNDVNTIVSKFTGIANDIKTGMISKIVEEPVITDTISSEFHIPENVKDTIQVSVNGQPSDGSIVSVNGDVIKFNLQNLNQQVDNNTGCVDICVSFDIEANDPYFSGDDVVTNKGYAILNYKNPKTHKEVDPKIVESPKVKIDPVEGSVYIQKVVDGYSDTRDVNAATNNFPIYIERVQDSDGYQNDNKNNYARDKYYFDVEGRAKVSDKLEDYSSMNFYLKGNSTDVTKINNANGDKNYIAAGTYKVNEIVPMDYKMEKIEIWTAGSNMEWKLVSNKDNQFTITKSTPNVRIVVSNKLDNKSYWRDRADTSNVFQLPQPQKSSK